MLPLKNVIKRRNPRRALMRRAQQWLAARERLVSAWVARVHIRARASMQAHVQVRRRARIERVGGAGAIMLPYWWEYESPLKRQLVLEAMLRRMFLVMPDQHVLP